METAAVVKDAPVIVFGGYGVFGGHVVRELSKRGITVTTAGRNPSQANLIADVTNYDSCLSALKGKKIAVNCSGPFSTAGSSLLDACLDAGCHYVDIADDRRYVSLVRNYGLRFEKKGLLAAYGCSSLPGISGALTLHARGTEDCGPRKVRVTLSIGNRNPKGAAAIQSALQRKSISDFESPEYDLFPEILGVDDVRVKVVFELSLVNGLFSLLTRLPCRLGRLGARTLQILSKPFQNLGSSGGSVTAELFFADGHTRKATLSAREEGQRMAVLPCVYVVQALLEGSTNRTGAATAFEILGAFPLLEKLVSDGCELQ